MVAARMGRGNGPPLCPGRAQPGVAFPRARGGQSGAHDRSGRPLLHRRRPRPAPPGALALLAGLARERDFGRAGDQGQHALRLEAARPLGRVEAGLEMRLQVLIAKEKKEGIDFKEIDLLMRQQERAARVRKYSAGGNEADLNPKVENRNKGPKRKAEKNVFSEEQQEKLHQAFLDSIFDYQKTWWGAGVSNRIRNLLKSRQIGATWYFAREALDDALQTGRNQIFLSASTAQAHVFKQYIIEFAREAVGVELRGDPVVLPNGATLYFLGTNARTAQSYHGNLYFDEYFWVGRFQDLRKVASGMAIHTKWRQTYFSTPSAITHDAYPFWSGALFNKGRPKEQRAKIDLSHAALKNGLACADGQWRQIVTVEDAVAGGCTLFNIDQLRLEYV